MKHDLATYILQNLDVLWTFSLLMARYMGMFLVLPGLSQGQTGLRVRIPAIFAFTLATIPTSKIAPLPDNILMMAVTMGLEMAFGFMLGLIPALIIAGVQTGASLANTTMGLGASQLIDPSSGTNVPALARLEGDFVILMFLLLGGHYVVINAVAGLNGSFTPGNISFDQFTLDLMITRTGYIFEAGVMISAPVIVALLLTQFVMGIISKAVPSVNIFIVSFPLTIGIGLVLTLLSLPEISRYIEKDFLKAEQAIGIMVENMTDMKPRPLKP